MNSPVGVFAAAEHTQTAGDHSPTLYLAPGQGPVEIPTLAEKDRKALNDITLAVEFLMVAARGISRGYPMDDPEVAQYLTFARLKIPHGTGIKPA